MVVSSEDLLLSPPAAEQQLHLNFNRTAGNLVPLQLPADVFPNIPARHVHPVWRWLQGPSGTGFPLVWAWRLPAGFKDAHFAFMWS